MINDFKIVMSSISTVDIKYNGKIVRFSGDFEPLQNRFRASMYSAKWMLHHSRSIPLSILECEQIVSVTNEYYRNKKNKEEFTLYFVDDSSLNLLLLKKKLVKLKIPHNSYCLTGGVPDGCFCISHCNSQWETYYSQNGNKTDLKIFVDESAACHDLLLRLRNQFL